jgi:hypothetical protein
MVLLKLDHREDHLVKSNNERSSTRGGSMRATTKITRTGRKMNLRSEGNDGDGKFRLKVKDGNTELTILDRYYSLPRGTRRGNKLIKQDTGKNFVVPDGSIDLSWWKGTIIRCTVSLFSEFDVLNVRAYGIYS